MIGKQCRRRILQRLIWVYTVCWGLSVWIHGVSTVISSNRTSSDIILESPPCEDWLCLFMPSNSSSEGLSRITSINTLMSCGLFCLALCTGPFSVWREFSVAYQLLILFFLQKVICLMQIVQTWSDVALCDIWSGFHCLTMSWFSSSCGPS